MLPQSVLDLVELSPVEDIALAVLQDGLPDVSVVSLIPESITPPTVLVRRDHGYGDWDVNPKFMDRAILKVQTFTADTEDSDGDEDGALLSEAVRVVLRNAWLNNTFIPGRGSIVRVDLMSEPSRITDWATAVGPVQYADLPTGWWRYEATYLLTIRKPVHVQL